MLWVQRGIDPADWRRFAPPGLGVRGELPGEWSVNRQPIHMTIGTVAWEKYTAVTAWGRGEYAVVAATYPPDAADHLDWPAALFTAVKDDLTLDGRLDREAHFETTANLC